MSARPPDRKHRTNVMNLHNYSAPIRAQPLSGKMPGPPAIRVGVLLQAICLAALFLQLPGPATAHSLAFSNNATIYSPSRAAASRPDNFFNESARIQRESGTSTGNSPSGPLEAANYTNNSQKLNASNSPADGATFLDVLPLNLSSSTNGTNITEQLQYCPGRPKNGLDIYFIDTQTCFPPLAACSNFSQQSKERISKTDEGQSPAADSPPSTSASFLWLPKTWQR